MSESIGQRIRRLRLAAGIRFQKQLANQIGIDPASLNQIEQGYRVPRLVTIEKLALALGVTRDVILDGDTGALPQQPKAAPEPPRKQAGAADDAESPAISQATERAIAAVVQTAIFDVLSGFVESISDTINATRAAPDAGRKTGASSHRPARRTPRH